LLASNLLTSKNQQLSKVIGEQASGMVAQKAAEIASQKS
jgi:biopolymer transport protein ExbB